MNEIIKKVIMKAVLGFSLGLLAGGFFMWIGGAPDTYLGVTGIGAIVLYLFCCGAYGIAVMEGQLLYDVEHYSLIRATLTHFLIIVVGLILLGVSFGWRLDDVIVWIIIGAYLIISVLVWIFMYLYTKHRVRKMNHNLQRWKSTHARVETGHSGKDR